MLNNVSIAVIKEKFSLSGPKADDRKTSPSLRRFVVLPILAILGLFLFADLGKASLVYALPPTPPQTESTKRVSVDSFGVEGNGDGLRSSISGDGRLIAFRSGSDDFAPGDTNITHDIFVHDTETGQTTIVSVDSNGVIGDGASDNANISADGRFVAFHSFATNLVANDNNSVSDVFVHDIQNGTTTRVSIDSSGGEGIGESFNPHISADGRFVVFESASNLVANDNNSSIDIFLHDTQTGQTTRVSVDSSGGEANDHSFNPRISGDGRFVGFRSPATDLVPDDTNGVDDIFLHDTQNGQTTRVSVDSSGNESNDRSFTLGINFDGRFIAFESAGRNLEPGDTNGFDDIFLHDTQTGQTTMVSRSSSGTLGNEQSFSPSLSDDGRFVYFGSSANTLDPLDNDGVNDAYIHDTQTSQTTRVSVSSFGSAANNGSSVSDGSASGISADGRFVTFSSVATNLVPNDTNNAEDIFVTVNTLHPAMTCNGLRPSIVGTAQSDFLMGTVGDDVILGLGGGSDLVLGLDGNDTICVDAGDDIIDGGNGDDWISGNLGDDEISAGAGNDTIFGGGGADLILASDGNDLIEGDNGADQISGGAGNDLIFAGRGADTLIGDLGDDLLVGDRDDDSFICGDGTDIADGGPGNDTSDTTCEIELSIP